LADDNNNPSLAHLAARQSIRRAFLTDFEVSVESAGGVDAFLYAAPMSEIERMQQRARSVIEDGYALPQEGAAAQIADQRARDFEALLADEHATRDLVSEPALTPEGTLGYSVPDELHLRVQENLARHLAFHEAKVSSPDYEHGEGFDHIAAASSFRSHLLAQQLDAYDRQLPVVPSVETQFVLGSHLHERATSAVLEAQQTGTGEWNQWTVAQSLADHPDYLRDAIDQHRQFRRDVAVDQGQGVYPVGLAEEHEAAWDAAAAEVDAGVNHAYGREAEHEQVAADMTPAQLGEAYMNADLRWRDIAPSLTDSRLDELTAWIDEHSEGFDGSLDQEYLDRHDELANHAYEEVYNRHASDRGYFESQEHAVEPDQPFSRVEDLIALQPGLAPLDLSQASADVDEALQQMANGPVATPARDAYLNARVEVGAVGAALDDPRITAALQLQNLQEQHQRISRSLPEGYDADTKPSFWRRRERAQWQAHQPVAKTLAANAEQQAGLRSQIGPDSDKLIGRAQALVDARNELVANAGQLQRAAVDEEIARDPEWLTETLGPRPEAATSRWQALAGELAANRLRFAVTDDADPGIRPEQTMLADKVAAFHLELAPGLDRSQTSDVGFGM
jgi:hypothetical protein